MKKHKQTGSRLLRTKLKPLTAAMLPLLILGLTNQALANDWTAGTGDWFTAGNWGGFVPTAANDVDIDNGGTAQIGAAGAVSGGIELGGSGGETGNISITAGGTYVSSSSSNYIGNSGTGNITVSGAGASWTANLSSQIYFGNSTTGVGSLNVSAGGTANINITGFNSLIVGNSGTASMTVDGTGSNLTVTTGGNFYIGLFSTSTGTLTVSNGGVITSNVKLRLAASGSGTLNIGAGGATGVLNTSEVNGGSSATVNFNHTDANHYFTKDGTAGGASILISGSAIVNKLGTGKTTLTGTNTYSGATTINAGTLSVNGSIASSSTTVNSGGTLGGTGTVGNVTINNGGTFAPGNSIGTTNVTGNVVFTAGSNYNVEVNAAGSSDKIIATGTATLTGATVNVQPEAGTYANVTDYTILTANGAGGLNGTAFSSVNSNLAFLTPTLSYDTNNVFLKLTRNDVTFNNVANTPNQLAVSNVLDNNKTALKSIYDNLLVLTNSGARQAFDSLSGVQHTQSSAVINKFTQQFQQMLFNHSSQSVNGALGFNAQNFNPMQGHLLADNSNNWQTVDTDTSSLVSSARGWWMQGVGGFGSIDNTTNASGADYQSGGFAFGVDTDWRDFIVGVAGSYAHSNVDPFAGDSDIDSFQAATYASWERNNIYMNASVGLGLHKVDATRTVTVGTSVSTASSDYDNVNVSTAVEAGKDITLNLSTTLTPYVGVSYSHNTRDDFTETGAGTANLSVNEQDEDSLRTTIGLRLSRDIKANNNKTITPAASIAYVREHMDSVSRMEAAFTAVPTSTFRINGSDLDRDRLQVGLGLTGQLNENTTLNVGYNGELAGSDDHHSFAATVNFVW